MEKVPGEDPKILMNDAIDTIRHQKDLFRYRKNNESIFSNKQKFTFLIHFMLSFFKDANSSHT